MFCGLLHFNGNWLGICSILLSQLYKTILAFNMAYDEERLRFVCSYFDPQAELQKQYIVTLYKTDASIELWDVKLNKAFLKRTKNPHLSESDFFIGNKIMIYSRLMTVESYADLHTQQTLEAKTKNALVLVPNLNLSDVCQVLKLLRDQGVKLSSVGTVYFSEENKELIEEIDKTATSQITDDHDMFIYIRTIGYEESHNSALSNIGCIVIDNNVEDLTNIFFNLELSADDPNDRIGSQSSCAIILPHSINNAADIITQMSKNTNLHLCNIRLNHLTAQDADTFLEAYKTILEHYSKKVEELSGGSSLALQFSTTNDTIDCITELREMAGPYDPNIARKLFPQSLRAKYGTDMTQNCIHCTDLPFDGIIESGLLFLARAK